MISINFTSFFFFFFTSLITAFLSSSKTNAFQITQGSVPLFQKQSALSRSLTTLSMDASLMDSILYDMPVSNNGARVRMLLKAKGLYNNKKHNIRIAPPSDIGGLKSDEYLALNPQGKMPLLVTNRGLPIPESDTICQYLLDKYSNVGPSMTPASLELRSLDRLIVRLHDTYLLPLQGCMYKAPGTVYSQFGTDRKMALVEFRKQVAMIESTLAKYDRFNADRIYKLKTQFEAEELNYLCGKELSLSDCTLFPTMVFTKFMLQRFFGVPKEQVLGPKLQKWWCYMCEKDPIGKETKFEIENALMVWEGNGRWDPIKEEMKQAN